MFKEKQLSFLETGNFQLARVTDDYIEFRSRTTGTGRHTVLRSV